MKQKIAAQGFLNNSFVFMISRCGITSRRRRLSISKDSVLRRSEICDDFAETVDRLGDVRGHRLFE